MTNEEIQLIKGLVDSIEKKNAEILRLTHAKHSFIKELMKKAWHKTYLEKQYAIDDLKESKAEKITKRKQRPRPWYG